MKYHPKDLCGVPCDMTDNRTSAAGGSFAAAASGLQTPPGQASGPGPSAPRSHNLVWLNPKFEEKQKTRRAT